MKRCARQRQKRLFRRVRVVRDDIKRWSRGIWKTSMYSTVGFGSSQGPLLVTFGEENLHGTKRYCTDVPQSISSSFERIAGQMCRAIGCVWQFVLMVLTKALSERFGDHRPGGLTVCIKKRRSRSERCSRNLTVQMFVSKAVAHRVFVSSLRCDLLVWHSSGAKKVLLILPFFSVARGSKRSLAVSYFGTPVQPVVSFVPVCRSHLD